MKTSLHLILLDRGNKTFTTFQFYLIILRLARVDYILYNESTI